MGLVSEQSFLFNVFGFLLETVTYCNIADRIVDCPFCSLQTLITAVSTHKRTDVALIISTFLQQSPKNSKTISNNLSTTSQQAFENISTPSTISQNTFTILQQSFDTLLTIFDQFFNNFSTNLQHSFVDSSTTFQQTSNILL